MRARHFVIILLGTLACMLMMDGLVLQPLWNGDSGSVYAFKAKSNPERIVTPYRPDHPSRSPSPSCDPPASIPEPSTLILLGMGATGISVYLYKGRKYRK